MDDRLTREGPTIRPAPTGLEHWLNRRLDRTASLLTSVVAFVLIVLVALALAGTVVATVEPILHHMDFMRAAVDGLDGAFLVVILLELVHTTLTRGPVSRQLQELLAVGIISAVRSGLEVVAERNTPARYTATSLAITAGAVLVMVAALWLIRQRPAADGDATEGR